jgi:hypothetical protein
MKTFRILHVLGCFSSKLYRQSKNHRRKTSEIIRGIAMKGSLITPESVDPYVTLENILKIIGRSWLSEEWRLEDVRLLAKEAMERRGKALQEAASPAVGGPQAQKALRRMKSSQPL